MLQKLNRGELVTPFFSSSLELIRMLVVLPNSNSPNLWLWLSYEFVPRY
jgi:hypothetical protein